MKALALLLAVLALPAAAQSGRFDRTNSRTPQGRSTRGFPGDPGYAFMEFAPASGAGMGTACACTTPTGAKGEALTFTRASTATCTKTSTGGLATTGIADGDLVQCASGQPRVEYDGAGVLGLLVESSRTNVLLRSDALTDATWADVGTPTTTNGATDPFNGATGDTLDDNDGAGFEGRSQSVTVTAATAYIMSCYVKAGASAEVTLSLDGTTCATTGLSSTTWTRAVCADASSSGVAISAQVLVGNGAASTGSVIVGGCQVEAGTYATSYIPTVAAAVTRVAEQATAAVTWPVTAQNICVGANATGWPNRLNGFLASVESAPTNYAALWVSSGFIAQVTEGGVPTRTSTSTTPPSDHRSVLEQVGTSLTFVVNGATVYSASSGSLSTWTPNRIGIGSWGNATGNAGDTIVSRIKADFDPLRCR